MMKPFLRSTFNTLRILRKMYGEHARECNYCQYAGRFFAYGKPVRLDAMCPKCGSLERERQLMLADKEAQFFTGKKVLHFAPESVLSAYIQSTHPKLYITTDLHDKSVDITLDIEQLPFADAQFDVIVNSHVLEHVDDQKALSELYRILAPGGIALIMVPLVEAWPHSYENPNATTKKQRELHFGQWDHVRVYGRDIRKRIERAGFELKESVAQEPQVHMYGLMRGETIFIATKNT